LFKKNDSAAIKERANAALAKLQRDSQAMSMLRSRLESKVNSNSQDQDLVKMLELARHGEQILNGLSEKITAVRFLEEFVMIMDSAAGSVNEIRGDIEYMIPIAEKALQEIHDTVSKISGQSYTMEDKSALDIQQNIIDEAVRAAATTTVAVPDLAAIVKPAKKELEAELA